jgi:hypothetical protein
MQAVRPTNLMDVDSLIQQFIEEREQSIATLHRIYFKSGNQLSLRALKEELLEELRTGCVTFLNKEAPMEELEAYLFYIVNAYCKKVAKPFVKQKIEYICPGCVFLSKEYSVLSLNKVFKCDECQSELKLTSDPKKVHFFGVFAQHNKQGYRCTDCERFIPHPLDNSSTVSCPYFDCFFAGSVAGLNKMHHPTSKSNPEKLILDVSRDGGISMKDSLQSQDVDVQTQLEVAEDLQDKLGLLQEIIETQSNNVPYSSSDATVRHKQFVYQAFSNLLEEFPVDMVGYLTATSDSHMGFQHKIFQEYIRLLEESFPFFVTKNRKLHKIDSLLDNTLCLFDGISNFDAVITDKLSIKNGTTDFYIGGRKAAYAKPYYIGKLLNVIHKETKAPLMHLVKDYSFSRIRMQDIKSGTPVAVTHLRVPPHYQMGGMAYVNRIRKKIVERAKVVIACQV